MSEEKVEYDAHGWKTDSKSKDSINVKDLYEISDIEPKSLRLFTPIEARVLRDVPPKAYPIDWDKVGLEEVKTILRHMYSYPRPMLVHADTEAYEGLKHVLIIPTED